MHAYNSISIFNVIFYFLWPYAFIEIRYLLSSDSFYYLQDNRRVHYINVTLEIEILSFMYSGAIIISAHVRTPAFVPVHCAATGNSIISVRITKSNFHCD